MTDADDALRSLHTHLLDAREGYAEGIDLAEKAEMKALFRELHDLHGVHAEELAAALAERGVETADSGSFMQTVHKAVLTVRAALTGLEENVIPSLVDGERRNLSAYDEAIGGLPAGSAISALVEGQRERLAARVALLDQTAADV